MNCSPTHSSLLPSVSSSSSSSSPCSGCCVHPPVSFCHPPPPSPSPSFSCLPSFGPVEASRSALSSSSSPSMFREMPTSASNYDGGAFSAGAMMPYQGFSNAPPPFLPVRRPKHKIKYNFCVFCKNNGEDETYYLSHTLKDDLGRVICPILSAYICPICGASGAVAHTIKYCPENKDDRYHESYASITMLKQLRTSTGKPRPVVCSGHFVGPNAGNSGLPPIGTPPMMARSAANGGAASRFAGPYGGAFGGFSSGATTPFDSPPMTPGVGLGMDVGHQEFGTFFRQSTAGANSDDLMGLRSGAGRYGQPMNYGDMNGFSFYINE